MMQNDILRASGDFTITQQKNGHLFNRSIRRLIAPSISGWIKMKSNPALLLWRQVSGQLKSLLIHLHSRMKDI